MSCLASWPNPQANFLGVEVRQINYQGVERTVGHMHQNFVHLRSNENAFFDDRDANKMSQVFKHFLAGQVQFPHARKLSHYQADALPSGNHANVLPHDQLIQATGRRLLGSYHSHCELSLAMSVRLTVSVRCEVGNR